ncbi:MAG: fatty acid desaturase [Vulcanimicrobiota bacterium]
MKGSYRAQPGALNLALMILISGLNGYLLWFCSHRSGWLLLGAVLAFSYSNHTMYSLLHEAIHGAFHRQNTVNDWAGRWCSGWFPTSFRLQRCFHLTHHRNNRTESEQWDYLRPGDNHFLKMAQWYAILTGLYWIFVPLASLLYLFLPGLLKMRVLRSSEMASQTASDEYLGALDKLDEKGARLDVLYSLFFQTTLFVILDLSVSGWAMCYAAFALNWSSLQYADHAFSPLDVTNGAWNLKTHPLVRGLLLNYPLHRAHHQHPTASWAELPQLVDPNEEPQPGFLENWLRMWKGPEKRP